MKGPLKRFAVRTIGFSLALAAGLASAVALATVSKPAPAQAATVDGYITRSEVLARAQYWVDQKYTYSQSQWKPDPQGKNYRTDCSGLVSMAWHINDSRVTQPAFGPLAFSNWDQVTYLGSLNDLKPGDALLMYGHMEMFAHWANSGDHTQGAYVYSFNTNGETVQNPTAVSNKGNLGFDKWSELTGFQPIRYKKIVDDNVPFGTVSLKAAVSMAQSGKCVSNVVIRSQANGGLVAAELGYSTTDYRYGMLRARSTSVGPWEKFSVCYDGSLNKFHLASQSNWKWVSAEFGYSTGDYRYGMLRARSDSIGPWEQFNVWDYGSYMAIYSSARQSYVSAEFGYSTGDYRYGMLRARSGAIGAWEKFM